MKPSVPTNKSLSAEQEVQRWIDETPIPAVRHPEWLPDDHGTLDPRPAVERGPRPSRFKPWMGGVIGTMLGVAIGGGLWYAFGV